MNTTQLEYFAMIARYNSLTKAAEQLHVSQPALSAALKKFEEELGMPLFDRTANRICLNEAGNIALAYAGRILQSVEQMKQELRSCAARSAALSIAFCDPGIQWFCIPLFSAAVPDIALVPHMYGKEDSGKLLRSQDYDIVVSPGTLDMPGIYSVPFLEDQVYLSVPKTSPYAAMESVSLRELEAQPLLIPTMGGYFLQNLEQIIRKENPRVMLVKHDWIVAQQLIRTTEMVTVSSMVAMLLNVRNDGPHRTLIPLRDAEQKTTYYINCLQTHKEKARPFLAWARRCKKQVQDRMRHIADAYTCRKADEVGNCVQEE